jgi:hypothetical protein
LRLARCVAMSDLKSDKSPPVPLEMQLAKGADGKAAEAAVPPVEDPNIAKLADELHANA